MKLSLIATFAALTLAAPAFAQDAADPAKGEKSFKACKACHAIIKPDGETIVKGGKVGPNLYGIVGAPVAHEEGFKYKDDILKVREMGIVWDEAMLAEYMTDPAAWLEAQLGVDKAKSGMTHKQKKDQADIAAYLASVAQ